MTSCENYTLKKEKRTFAPLSMCQSKNVLRNLNQSSPAAPSSACTSAIFSGLTRIFFPASPPSPSSVEPALLLKEPALLLKEPALLLKENLPLPPAWPLDLCVRLCTVECREKEKRRALFLVYLCTNSTRGPWICVCALMYCG